MITQIYFIRCDATRAVKIGIAADPGRRVRQLQTGSPGLLTIMACIPGGPDLEAYFHRKYAAKRLRGEWFAIGDADILQATGCVPTKPQGRRDPRFAVLAKADPRLWDVLALAESYRWDTRPRFCAEEVWYGYDRDNRADWGRGVKGRMIELVGWFRRPGHPLLSTTFAYELAYRVAYDALPACRDCPCLGLDDDGGDADDDEGREEIDAREFEGVAY